MTLLSPTGRRIALIVHVVVSVAFPGAVACFLSLAIVGLLGDAGSARADYAAMQIMTLWVILPLCAASLVSGVVSAVGTPWGLFRYWWVVVKLALTALSMAILLVHLRPIDAMAHLDSGQHGTQTQLLIAAAAAIVALVFMTALSIVKPRGAITRARSGSP